MDNLIISCPEGGVIDTYLKSLTFAFAPKFPCEYELIDDSIDPDREVAYFIDHFKPKHYHLYKTANIYRLNVFTE